MPDMVTSREGRLAGVDSYLTAFERFGGRRAAEPAWLRESRRTAIEHFAGLGFPTTRDEEWKFTSVAPLAERRFSPDEAPPVVRRPEVAPFSLAGEACAELVFVNGAFAPALSSLEGRPGGLRIEPLGAVLAGDASRVEAFIRDPGFTENASFTALNTAFLHDGAVVEIAPHAVIDRPIHVCFLSAAAAGPVASSPRVVIVAGENSQACVVETYAGLHDTASFTNAVTQIVLGGHAVVDHYKVQQEAVQGFHVATMHVRASRSSTFASHSIAFGGGLVRNEVVAVLGGEGVDCTLKGLYLANRGRLIDNHTTIDHAMPHCGSHELYKGILGGRARGVFNGKIVVRPDAQKTDAKQTNRALLLSDQAQINSKPQLEIFANDVKCTHGATIGQLDDDAIFYLRARGLSLERARSLLIHAFAREILEQIKVGSLGSRLERVLERQLDIEES